MQSWTSGCSTILTTLWLSISTFTASRNACLVEALHASDMRTLALLIWPFGPPTPVTTSDPTVCILLWRSSVSTRTLRLFDAATKRRMARELCMHRAKSSLQHRPSDPPHVFGFKSSAVVQSMQITRSLNTPPRLHYTTPRCCGYLKAGCDIYTPVDLCKNRYHSQYHLILASPRLLNPFQESLCSSKPSPSLSLLASSPLKAVLASMTETVSFPAAHVSNPLAP